MNSINYSIIIPHKNSPNLLQYCLDSIPVRNDVQVIVVDDNSDMDKVDFRNFPKWSGENYEVYFTKEGKGAGYARNVGLEHAIGKWTIFADSDDFFLPSLDKILNDNLNIEADIVFYRPQAVMLKDFKIRSKRADGYNYLIDEAFKTGEISRYMLSWMSPCSKILRKDIIDGIKFEEIRYSNDNFFSVATTCNAGIIEIRNESFYMITSSDNSLTSNFLNKKGELECRSAALLRSFFFAKEKGKDVRSLLDTMVYFTFKLHGRNWPLYTQYVYYLKKEGVGLKKIFREQYREMRRLERCVGYIVTFFHIFVERLKLLK